MVRLVGGPNTGSSIPGPKTYEIGKIYRLRDGRRYQMTEKDGQLYALYLEEDE